MKKRFKKLSDDEIREFMNSSDLNMFLLETFYLIEQWRQGKLFFKQDKI